MFVRVRSELDITKVCRFFPNTVELTDPKASSLIIYRLQTKLKLFSVIPASTTTDNGSAYTSVSDPQ